MNKSRITVVSPDKQHLGDIERILQGLAHVGRTLAIEGTLQRIGKLTPDTAADILIVDCDGDDIAELAPLQQIGELHPRTAVIVLSKRQEPAFLIHAMRLGVREVLPSPASALTLDDAIVRVVNKGELPARHASKVVAFVGCKGGSGATFLAANFASSLAAQGGSKVALFDLNLQFGDALMFLSEQKAAHTLSDVVRGIHRLDLAFLKSSMVNVAPNLDLLAAPEDPADGMQVKAEHIDALLATARRHYDYIILDVGRAVDAPTVRALDQADQIYAVLQGALPFVRGAKHMLEVFDSLGYPENKVSLVLNRYERGGEVDLKSLESALGRPIFRTVPNHYEAAVASANQGIPINSLMRGSPLSRSLADWSAQLQERPVREGGSWITRLFKHA